MKILFTVLSFIIFQNKPVHGKAFVMMHNASDSISRKHYIPIDVLGWKIVFEMNTEDNVSERGIIIYHISMDKDGRIISLAHQGKNVDDQVEIKYCRQLKKTWQVVGYKDKNPPEKTEGNFELHVAPLQ